MTPLEGCCFFYNYETAKTSPSGYSLLSRLHGGAGGRSRGHLVCVASGEARCGARGRHSPWPKPVSSELPLTVLPPQSPPAPTPLPLPSPSLDGEGNTLCLAQSPCIPGTHLLSRHWRESSCRGAPGAPVPTAAWRSRKWRWQRRGCEGMLPEVGLVVTTGR